MTNTSTQMRSHFVFSFCLDKAFKTKRERITAQGAVVACMFRALLTGKGNVRFNYFVISTGGHQ